MRAKRSSVARWGGASLAILLGAIPMTSQAADAAADSDVGGVKAADKTIRDDDGLKTTVAGYFRGLVGRNSETGKPACLKLPGAGSKYRLGNECEDYGELFVGQDLARLGNGGKLSANLMVAPKKPIGVGLTDKDVTGRLVQAYVQASQLSFLNGGNLWAGRRYYKREDIHINDFFYWNPSGLGAGVDDIGVGGPLKLSYAFFREDAQFQKPNVTRHDLQLRGIPTNRNGSLEIGWSLIPSAVSSLNGDSGWSLTVQHRQTGLFGDGWNKLAVQYGKGPGTGLGQLGGLGNTQDYTRWRIVEGIYAQLSRDWGGQLTAIYQEDKMPGDKRQRWTSLGGRVSYALSDNFKLLAELGHDQVKPDDSSTRHLTKFTFAPTLALERGFFARPELRFFYTYASWNRAAAAAADPNDPSTQPLSDVGIFSGKTHGSMFGIQVEGWW